MRTFTNFLLLAACALGLGALLSLSGCAHPAPRPITLPTAAAVRAPIVAAQSSTARAARIVASAGKTGLAAGSVALRDLSADLADVTMQLATAKGAVDKLTAQLLAAQGQVDAQTTRLADLTVKLNAAEKSLWWYRLRFWGPIVGLLLAGALFLVIRFTSWGAKTFGPYILGVEKVAAKAAVLA